MLWRAFDKTVRRKPLAFAADAVYGNSIDLELEVVARKGVARKALLLMFVNVLLLAFTPMIVRRGSSSFKRRYACTHTRGSVRRVSGFVLTGKQEVIRPGRKLVLPFYQRWMGIIGKIRVSPPQNLLVKWRSQSAKLAADSICQPCVWSDTYDQPDRLPRRCHPHPNRLQMVV